MAAEQCRKGRAFVRLFQSTLEGSGGKEVRHSSRFHVYFRTIAISAARLSPKVTKPRSMLEPPRLCASCKNKLRRVAMASRKSAATRPWCSMASTQAPKIDSRTSGRSPRSPPAFSHSSSALCLACLVAASCAQSSGRSPVRFMTRASLTLPAPKTSSKKARSRPSERCCGGIPSTSTVAARGRGCLCSQSARSARKRACASRRLASVRRTTAHTTSTMR
mmetsp:Transcript_101274/g.294944  ORF Transcript_101274/g.294944 Transcript_101274/m.294944 type:complete len:220 (+) Transcript_101274:1080-1739(+)